jgi:hypothetical protein
VPPFTFLVRLFEASLSLCALFQQFSLQYKTKAAELSFASRSPGCNAYEEGEEQRQALVGVEFIFLDGDLASAECIHNVAALPTLSFAVEAASLCRQRVYMWTGHVCVH